MQYSVKKKAIIFIKIKIKKNDCDAVDYAELLKEKLIETYICMVHALEKPEDNQLLQSHFPKLMDFI